MSLNKYALGTIVGAALIGLSKSKIGSHIRIKRFHFFKPDSLSVLPVVLKDPSKLADSVVKIDCQGNESVIELINAPHFSMLSEGSQQEIINLNEEHHYCPKNENGECVSFLPPNQKEVKKAAEKILKLITDLSKERIYVIRIRDTKIELEDVHYHQRIKTYKRFKDNVLVIRKPYDKWHEHNLKNICNLITPQIHEIGYFTMQMHMPFEGAIRLNHHPNTDAGKEELSAEIYKIIDEIFGPFGFMSDRTNRPYDHNLNFNYLTKSHLMVKKDDEWILYEKPKETETKLRKR